MFLYTKRSKKVIKWIWGVFAVLVSLSMIFAFSGFTMLSGTPPQSQPTEIPPEVIESLRAQMENATATPQTNPEIQALLDQLNASATPPSPDSAPVPTPETPAQDATPTVPELQFSL